VSDAAMSLITLVLGVVNALLLGWLLSFIIASGILSELTLKTLRVARRLQQRMQLDYAR
jgi:hypothetical protein